MKFVRATESVFLFLVFDIIRVGQEVECVVVLLRPDGLALQLSPLVPLKGGDILHNISHARLASQMYLEVSPVPVVASTMAFTPGSQVKIVTGQVNTLSFGSPSNTK